MNRLAKLLALLVAVLALQSVPLNGLVMAQTPIESIPVPEPVPEPADPLSDTDFDLLTDDSDIELSELDDSDEFKLEPVPDSSPNDDDIVVLSEDEPLLILQDEVNSSKKNVIIDPKVSPASHVTAAGETVTANSNRPLILSSSDEEPALEPIVDRQLSGASGISNAPRFSSPLGTTVSSVPATGEFVPNYPGIVSAPAPTNIVQPSVGRIVQPAGTPVIRPGVVYQQPIRSYGSGYQPAQPTYRYQQQVTTPRPAPYRVPAVVQQPVVNQQPVVVQQSYPAYQQQPVPTQRRFTNQNQTAVTRVQQTGPNTFRVTTETTRYVPVQVRVQTPVYQPGIPGRPNGAQQAVPVDAGVPPGYLPGRPLRNALRGVFR